MLSILATFGLVAGMVGALVSTAGAATSQVSCGDTITTDTNLDSDLVDCPNHGIVIGADNITLDLNGHTIDGDGELVDPCPDDQFCDLGVDNTAGHDGVTIKGGSIREFALGVFILGASDNRLRHLSVSMNLFLGIVIGESARSRVERTSVTRNGLTTDAGGMFLFASHDNRIERNRLSGNGSVGLGSDEADDNRIVKNTFSDNPEAGIFMFGDGNKVSRNRILRNGDGIVSEGNDNTFTRNHIDASGCPENECGIGISLEGGTDNLIAHNIIAPRHTGIWLDNVDNTVAWRNLLRDAGVDGILVTNATDSLLQRNIAIGAGDDGIDVDSPTTTLTRNLALRNGDLGIEAVPGVTDGGGNKARGNGNPVQCTNVDCA